MFRALKVPPGTGPCQASRHEALHVSPGSVVVSLRVIGSHRRFQLCGHNGVKSGLATRVDQRERLETGREFRGHLQT